MTTTPATPTSTSPSAQAAASTSPGGLPAAGFHLPSYLLGLITALILLGAMLYFWPRPQPAALQLQAPPPFVPEPSTLPTTIATVAPTVTPTPGPLVVFVSGAVAQPGLYTLAPTARIGDALAAAGGLLPGVDASLINQAQPLIDGAQLHIPAPTAEPATAAATAPAPAEQPMELDTQAQVAVEAAPVAAPPVVQPPAGLSVAPQLALPTPTVSADAPPDAPSDAPAPAVRAAAVELPATGALINVNTASGAELESLPGIGPAKAQAIIDNRPFATVDELDRVPGIGPATLEQIRPLVTCAVP